MIELLSEQDLGRVKNTIQDYLVHKLLLPKVYLDADLGGTRVDVLAIDRTGLGDVHAVRIAPVIFEDGKSADWGALVTLAAMRIGEHAQELLRLPGHFRYVAVFNESSDLRRLNPTQALIRRLMPEDGVGRVGILTVDFEGDEPSVREVLRPERFRSSKEIVELADKFVAEHTANWEVRE